MKTRLTSVLVLSGAVAGLVLCGCAKFRTKTAAPPPAPTAAQPAQPAGAPQPGPAYGKVEEGGVAYLTSEMAFPTGHRESSGLLLEKMVPAEVLAGHPFEYRYKVSNLTDYPLEMVTVFDRMSGNFTAAEAEPKPSDMHDGIATWQLGTLGGKETKLIRITGSGQEEGALNTCAWASYSQVMCQEVRVTKPCIQLSKLAPAEMILCEPIPVTVTIKNIGSSALTGIKVTETLPEGLLSEGKNMLTFEADALAPGQSRDFSFKATAANPGKFVPSAKVTCLQGVEAEASSEIVVRQPMLQLSATAPQEHYLGRSFEAAFLVANKGDTNAAGTILEVPLAAGLTFKSATEGGRLVADKVVWDLGSLGMAEPRQVAATFLSANAGPVELKATAKGECAAPVSAACQTKAMGVTALLLEKADDPDPVQIGESTTYTVRITNQGTAEAANVRMVVTLPEELTPLSATSECTILGQTVTFPVVNSLAPKAVVAYKISAKGVKAGDGRTRFTLTADDLKSPVMAEESTTVY